MSNVIILGSSRNNGNTANLSHSLAKRLNAEVVNLKHLNILPYDYEFKNREDDFLSLINHLLTFENLIFASPIYWYSPSATMKLFLDRLCDLLEIYKPLGRAMKNKGAYILSSGAATSAPGCFEQIFSSTFDYFDMHYKGMLYCQFNDQMDAASSHDTYLDNFITQHIHVLK